jgi:hypothetical protein
MTALRGGYTAFATPLQGGNDGLCIHLWWLAAGALVAAELATGTFYLLMLALGCAPARWPRMPGCGRTAADRRRGPGRRRRHLAWHLQAGALTRARRRRRRNRDVNLDIGEPCRCRPGQRRQRPRAYRGSTWTARLAAGRTGAARPACHRAVRRQPAARSNPPPR